MKRILISPGLTIILCFFLIPDYLSSQTLDETIDLIVNNYLSAGG
jgi:hypothetical protein